MLVVINPGNPSGHTRWGKELEQLVDKRSGVARAVGCNLAF